MELTEAVRRPGRSRGYARLFAAGVINGIGDRFSGIAILALVLKLTGSGMAVGITLALRVLPALLLAPAGGMLASRMPRKSILITADLLRIPVALSFLWVDGEARLWLLYAASFLLAAGEAVYAPVRKSSIPLLVQPAALLKVNGLEQLMTGVVLILGAAAGGAVSLMFGPDMAFVLNASSFLLAALLIRGIRFPVICGGERSGDNPANQEERLMADAGGSDRELDGSSCVAADGRGRGKSIRFLLAASLPLQAAVAYELLVPMVNGVDNVLISVYAVQEFHKGDLGVGILYAALGAGLSLSFLAGRLLKGKWLAGALCGLLLEGILLTFVSISPSFWLTCALFVLVSFSGGVAGACLDTLLMKHTPAVLQPLLFGWLTAASGTCLGLSMLTAGLLLERIAPRSLGLAGGIGFTIIALGLAGYVRLRGRRDGAVTAPWRTP